MNNSIRNIQLVAVVVVLISTIIAFFLENLPNPLLTRDQINLLRHDSVSAKGLVNLKKVVKNPASMETIVKNYL